MKFMMFQKYSGIISTLPVTQYVAGGAEASLQGEIKIQKWLSSSRFAGGNRRILVVEIGSSENETPTFATLYQHRHQHLLSTDGLTGKDIFD